MWKENGENQTGEHELYGIIDGKITVVEKANHPVSSDILHPESA